ncbi:hypothetical protein GOODEAATRI_022505, partial [Goodea atripinnis]
QLAPIRGPQVFVRALCGSCDGAVTSPVSHPLAAGTGSRRQPQPHSCLYTDGPAAVRWNSWFQQRSSDPPGSGWKNYWSYYTSLRSSSLLM